MISRKDSNDTIYKRILFNYHSFQLANRKLVPRPWLKSSRYCFLGPSSCFSQPRPQGLLVFQYGGGKREDPRNDVVVFSSFSLTLMMIFLVQKVTKFIKSYEGESAIFPHVKPKILRSRGWAWGWACFFFTAYNIINIQTQVNSGETLEGQPRSQGSLLPVPGNEVARRERKNRTG